ncbi:hypothetical protein [Curtobacterium sp. MCSS17_015]|uniref:hypothetical protein n=1 Tax=Curtobacterium sp. MCSS17_015 TaxID=2175666 RepID=UPI000DA92DA8|nr:hypothetical protein [Curtobacterium sp. MCSS17_015]WIB25804.1 hypothetical protein DEJ18_12200 [Curtobacterium sp. MCSS17_015]
MGDHEKTPAITVESIWYRGQRVLRTLLTTALTVLPLIPQVVQIVQGQWPAASGLTVVAVQALAINSALTAIIAIPAVNTALTHIGFGSVPRAAAKRQTVAKQVGEVSPPQIIDGTDQVR